MRLSEIPEIQMAELLERYRAVFLDAYGVLVHHHGPLAGAGQLVEHLEKTSKPYWILSNDASRSVSTTARRFLAMDLPIPAERILNSGSLLAGYFERAGLAGARCVVLGPEDSKKLVRDAGGVLIGATEDCDLDVLVVCDEEGYALVEALDATVTALARRITAGHPVRLVLPNPDVIYLRGPTSYGMTAGAVALVIEAALARLFGDRDELRFDKLGKPHAPLYEAAMELAGTPDAVMIGDQLETDIAGACGVGIDSALVATGVAPLDSDRELEDGMRPTHRLRGLVP